MSKILKSTSLVGLGLAATGLASLTNAQADELDKVAEKARANNLLVTEGVVTEIEVANEAELEEKEAAEKERVKSLARELEAKVDGYIQEKSVVDKENDHGEASWYSNKAKIEAENAAKLAEYEREKAEVEARNAASEKAYEDKTQEVAARRQALMAQYQEDVARVNTENQARIEAVEAKNRALDAKYQEELSTYYKTLADVTRENAEKQSAYEAELARVTAENADKKAKYEAELNRVTNENKVKEDKYAKEKAEADAHNEEVRKKNEEIKAQNEADKARVEAENKAKQDAYEKELAEYNKQKAESDKVDKELVAAIKAYNEKMKGLEAELKGQDVDVYLRNKYTVPTSTAEVVQKETAEMNKANEIKARIRAYNDYKKELEAKVGTEGYTNKLVTQSLKMLSTSHNENATFTLSTPGFKNTSKEYIANPEGKSGYKGALRSTKVAVYDQVSTGFTTTVNYGNLKGYEVTDKEGDTYPISRIERTIRVGRAGSEGKIDLYVLSDPSESFVMVRNDGQGSGDWMNAIVTDRYFYMKDGKEVLFEASSENPVALTYSSLNNNRIGKEGAKPEDNNELVLIAGSTISIDQFGFASSRNYNTSEEVGVEWDSATSPHRYKGAAIGVFKSGSSFATNFAQWDGPADHDNKQSYWFSINTDVVTPTLPPKERVILEVLNEPEVAPQPSMPVEPSLSERPAERPPLSPIPVPDKPDPEPTPNTPTYDEIPVEPTYKNPPEKPNRPTYEVPVLEEEPEKPGLPDFPKEPLPDPVPKEPEVDEVPGKNDPKPDPEKPEIAFGRYKYVLKARSAGGNAFTVKKMPVHQKAASGNSLTVRLVKKDSDA